MVFQVKAGNDAHIGLAASVGNTDSRVYEVVIGGNNNTQSFIRRSPQANNEVLAETKDILSANEYRTFWIRWANNNLEVGEGSNIGVSKFMSWDDISDPHSVTGLSLSTGWGATGDWQFSYITGELHY